MKCLAFAVVLLAAVIIGIACLPSGAQISYQPSFTLGTSTIMSGSIWGTSGNPLNGDIVFSGSPEAETGWQFVDRGNPGSVWQWYANSGSARLYNGGDQLTVTTAGAVTVPALHSTTGTLYVCVNTSGQLVSSATACSGT